MWTHQTGRKSLVLSSTMDHVIGLDADEGQGLLQDLLARTISPERVWQHSWSVGDMLIWDNTGVLHRATPYDPTSRREMHRCTILGTNPSSDPGDAVASEHAARVAPHDASGRRADPVSRRTAVVTGGGSGIGAAIGRRLAADGAAVALFDLNGAAAEATAASIEEGGGTAIAQSVTSPSVPELTPGWMERERVLGRRRSW